MGREFGDLVRARYRLIRSHDFLKRGPLATARIVFPSFVRLPRARPHQALGPQQVQAGRTFADPEASQLPSVFRLFVASQMSVQQPLGTILAGSWANTILYFLEGYLVYQRLAASSDARWARAAMVLAFLSDSACTACEYATMWLFIIEHWGDRTLLVRRLPTLSGFVGECIPGRLPRS